MKKTLTIVSYILVAVLASAITFGIVAVEDMLNKPKLERLEALIEDKFIGEPDKTAMEDAAATAMVAAMGDRWSYYIPASEEEAYQEQMKNAYVGIGVTIQEMEDGSGLLIIKLDKNGPAEEAGVRIGDVIVAVEGERIAGKASSETREYIRGEEGTEVVLTVLRNGKEQDISVERRRVEVAVATGQMLTDSIGLVSIVNFNTRCASETIAIIEDLLDQGAESLIFDVRFNPGGYADELVKLLDYLLPEGELFRTVNYSGREKVDTSDAKYLDVPMAVLVNGDSYSAAEFFAAALREYDAAIVVGEQTVGKGYFQTTFSLGDGSLVGLSIGKYYTPKGVSLEGVGITPDVVVEVDQETAIKIYTGTIDPLEDPQIQAAMDALSK